MAFTITFPTSGPLPTPADVAAWLTDQAEPFDASGPHTFSLGAMPLRLVLSPEQDVMQAWLEVTANAPLIRMIDLLFAFSVRAGADVRLAGVGEVTRSSLWLRLADEQDRLRLAEALARGADRGIDEILKRLWALLGALAPGRDLRWDVGQLHIVEMVEVDAPGGITAAEAGFLVEGAVAGDVVPRPVQGQFHMIAWRWLCDACPGLAEP